MVDILCRSTTHFSGTSMRAYYLPETSLDEGCKLFPLFCPCIKPIMTYLCIHKVGYKGHGTWCHVYTYGDMWWDHCKTVYHMLIYSSMLQAYRHSIYWRLCKQKKNTDLMDVATTCRLPCSTSWPVKSLENAVSFIGLVNMGEPCTFGCKQRLSLTNWLY
jgi:hypothetical protein